MNTEILKGFQIRGRESIFAENLEPRGPNLDFFLGGGGGGYKSNSF